MHEEVGGEAGWLNVGMSGEDVGELLNFPISTGKEYVCVVRLHDAIASRAKLAQVRLALCRVCSGDDCKSDGQVMTSFRGCF